jgi:hypothetical protein
MWAVVNFINAAILLAGTIPPQFYHQGPAGNGMGMNSRMMHPNYEEYERNHGEKS